MAQIAKPICNNVETLDSNLAARVALELGLSAEEYENVVKTQGRRPSLTELYIYSLMWSEHCSYKHSRAQLRKFSSEGEHVLQGPGENAGVISVGDGWAVAFKMESHNHPSAIEPYEGAATGVGGIIRDIFTMGARPIASMNSLRFGTLDKPRQRYLLDGAVAGIGGYGNCLGVPTVGGEIYFDKAYEGNCLINAFSLGLMREEDLTRAVGSGPGNPVVLIGNSTGRDGIGGASVLASQEFDEAAENKRPAVQVGDPFEEKLLIEVCLELLGRGKFVALGDLGAAGLTSSASEMASRGGVGIEIDVQKVPQRETEMKPFEIMVSESQERMLAVVRPEDVADVEEACKRWGVKCSVIGQITDTGRFVVRDTSLPTDRQIVADMPALQLAEDAPLYYPESKRPSYLDEVAAFDPYTLNFPDDVETLSAHLLALLASSNICSREWVWRQYDHQVQNSTALLPGADSAVVRVGAPGRGAISSRGIAMTTDCNGHYCWLDPYTGAKIAVAESVRNLACVGATPSALTDCLNFGNPEKPEVFYTFERAIDGMSEACKFFEIPVISGNVSFYNESFGNAIYPTPAVGTVGVMDDYTKYATPAFKQVGDTIILVGETADELGGSEYLSVLFDELRGSCPACDLELERDTSALVRQAVADGIVASAHDISEGGAAVALAKCAIAGNLGAQVVLDDDLPPAASLFAETQARFIISVDNSNAQEFIERLVAAQVPYSVIGEVVDARDGIIIEEKVKVSLDEATHAFKNALEEMLR
ncbi:MAG: phosphoribosylformylglycinamidine synthase subunit PurL [Eggerthellaceae bacterium]|jgi:phosphoribosylformylglycinamidine synthase|nr:phosphoribosylformylglycinamidine synthase subunit PurL [Eggerthellaceae bacterium]MDR2721470.1 phosphoribosylformylglycinamidine synthase subunit PurL [Coriobacteriaceae bacterium]